MRRLDMLAALDFGTANDGEFAEAVQRAICAYCILYRASYAEAASVASDWVRKVGKKHAKNLEANTWLSMIREGRPAPPRLRLVDGDRARTSVANCTRAAWRSRQGDHGRLRQAQIGGRITRNDGRRVEGVARVGEEAARARGGDDT